MEDIVRYSVVNISNTELASIDTDADVKVLDNFQYVLVGNAVIYKQKLLPAYLTRRREVYIL